MKSRRFAMLVLLSIAFASSAREGVPLPGDVHVIPGAFVPGRQPDGNTVIFDGRDGLIVFDTGRHVEHTQKIIDYAHEKHQPVKAIINSHWHLDHVGGNLLLKSAFPDVHVYASNALSGALNGFLDNYHKQLEDVLAKSTDAEEQKSYRAELALIDAGAKLGPDNVVTQSGDVTIAGRKLRLELDRNAVTAADVWVFDRKTGVVAAGDLVTLPAPFLDTACPAGWSNELARIEKTPFRALIPGHGAPMDRAGFATYRAAFDHLLDCAKSDKAKEACIEGWVSETRTLRPDSDEKFTRSLMSYYIDVLRGDPMRIAKLCGAK